MRATTHGIALGLALAAGTTADAADAPWVRVGGNVGLGFLGPGEGLQAALSTIPETVALDGHLPSEYFLGAVEVRVPGARHLWLRVQKTHARLADARVEDTPCLFAGGCTTNIEARAPSLGFLLVGEAGRFRFGAGPARHSLETLRFGASDSEVRWGVVGHVGWDAVSAAIGGSRAILEVGAQYHVAGSPSTGRPVGRDPGDASATLRPSFNHAAAFLGLAVAF